jgi:two-component system sensor histidine kinase DesK
MTAQADTRTVGKASPAPSREVTARAVTATWWYTIAGVMFFELVVVLVWAATFSQAGIHQGKVIAFLSGGLVWILSTISLLRTYRHRTGEATSVDWRSILLPMVVAAGYGVLGWALSGLWVLLLLPLAQSLQLLDWPRSVRTRMVLAVTAVLAAVWIVDINVTFSELPMSAVEDRHIPGVFSILLPCSHCGGGTC